jgi:hypothetical protein
MVAGRIHLKVVLFLVRIWRGLVTEIFCLENSDALKEASVLLQNTIVVIILIIKRVAGLRAMDIARLVAALNGNLTGARGCGDPDLPGRGLAVRSINRGLSIYGYVLM